MQKLTLRKYISYLLVLFVVFAPAVTLVHKPSHTKSQSVVFKSIVSEYSMNAQMESQNTKINKTNIPNYIPKYIHQIVESKKDIPKNIKKSINSWKKMNPKWTHIIYDEYDIKKFMKENHSDIYEFWDSLETKKEKYNMWKYMILDTIGGVYSDSDIYCVKPIDEWLKDKKYLAVVGIEHINIPVKKNETNKKLTDTIQFTTNVMMSAPKHEIVHNMPYYINRYLKLDDINVNEYESEKSKKIFYSTGPGIWTESIFNYLIEHGTSLEEIKNGGEIGDLLILNTNGFSYNGNTDDIPSDVYIYRINNENDDMKKKNELK